MEKSIQEQMQAEIIWTFTKNGAFQRSWIYKQPDGENNWKFRKAVKSYLFENIFLKYKGKRISESQLIFLIQDLIKISNRKFKGILAGELRFGNAQKFVNLYLKAMWIFGYLKTPPHFPVDAVIQRPLKTNKAWTNMDEDEYNFVIEAAKLYVKKERKFQTIADWELCVYLGKYINRIHSS